MSEEGAKKCVEDKLEQKERIYKKRIDQIQDFSFKNKGLLAHSRHHSLDFIISRGLNSQELPTTPTNKFKQQAQRIKQFLSEETLPDAFDNPHLKLPTPKRGSLPFASADLTPSQVKQLNHMARKAEIEKAKIYHSGSPRSITHHNPLKAALLSSRKSHKAFSPELNNPDEISFSSAIQKQHSPTLSNGVLPSPKSTVSEESPSFCSPLIRHSSFSVLHKPILSPVTKEERVDGLESSPRDLAYFNKLLACNTSRRTSLFSGNSPKTDDSNLLIIQSIPVSEAAEKEGVQHIPELKNRRSVPNLKPLGKKYNQSTVKKSLRKTFKEAFDIKKIQPDVLEKMKSIAAKTIKSQKKFLCDENETDRIQEPTENQRVLDSPKRFRSLPIYLKVETGKELGSLIPKEMDAGVKISNVTNLRFDSLASFADTQKNKVGSKSHRFNHPISGMKSPLICNNKEPYLAILSGRSIQTHQ